MRNAAALSLIVAALAVSGCRNTRVQVFNETIIGGSGAQDVRPLRYGAGLAVRSFNPNGAEGWCEATALLHARLFTVDGAGRVVEDLVEMSWIEGAGRIWRLQLLGGVTFHDGAPLTSRDVVATFEALEDLEGSEVRENLSTVRKVEALSDLELTIELEAPCPELPGILCELAILPAHELAQETPLGAGPYAVVGAEPSVVFFQAHGRYHRGRPRTEYVTLPIIEDDRQRARALADGVIDLACVSPENLADLGDFSRFRIHTLPSGVVRAIPLDLQAEGLGDPRVRRALSELIDREALVSEALGGHGRAAALMIAPESVVFDAELAGARGDPAGAAGLLDAAGWPRGADGLRRSARTGRPLTVRLAAWQGEVFRRRAGPLIVAAWRRAGIDAALIPVDHAEYVRLARDLHGNAEGYIGGWGGGLIAPVSALRKKFGPGGGQNRSGFEDPEVDRLLRAASQEESLTERRALVAQALERLDREMPWIPLVYPSYVFAVSTAVEGFQCDVVDSWYEFPRHLWQIGIATR